MITKGNFSIDPATVLADATSGTLRDGTRKNYVAVRVEQGVPVLDRDLNLLGDLIWNMVQSVVRHHIGDSAVANGFRIGQVNPTANDFSIEQGTCLIDGYEVILSKNTNYSAQIPVPPALTDPGGVARTDTVYLDVWRDEVDETTDAGLANLPDVGMRTSTRLRVASVVRVNENATSLPSGQPPAGHTYFNLASITRSNLPIKKDDITDRRQRSLYMPTLASQINALYETISNLTTTVSNLTTTVATNQSQLSQLILTMYGDFDRRIRALERRSALAASPVITEIPAILVADGVTQWSVSGLNFQAPGQAPQQVSVSNAAGSLPITVTSSTDTLLKLVVPPLAPPPPTPAGVWQLTVQNGDPTTNPATATVTIVQPPQLAAAGSQLTRTGSFNPVNPNQSVQVTLHGSNLQNVNLVIFNFPRLVNQVQEQIVSVGNPNITIATDGTWLQVWVPFDASDVSRCTITVAAQYNGNPAGQATTSPQDMFGW
jgi:hypothetical protein